MPRKKASEMTPDELARYRESERLRNQRRAQYRKEWQANNKDRAAEYVKRYTERNADALREKAKIKSEQKALERGAYLALHIKSCAECGKKFLSRRENAGVCSEACRVENRRKTDWQSLKCQTCGSLFSFAPYSGRPRVYCSDECGQQVKRIARSVRRARERAATVELVDPLLVFERDNWTCKLCGVLTPKKLRGTYEKTAPELDHIVPISKGGAHSYANTQCLCRSCNGLKSDAMPHTPAYQGGYQTSAPR